MTETLRRAGLATDTNRKQSFDRDSREEDISVLSHGFLSSYGGAMRIGSWTEEVTLDTGAATTDTTNTLPANSIILCVMSRVTATFGTAASYKLGDATSVDRFLVSNSSVTAGDTAIGLSAQFGVVSTTATGPTIASAIALRITPNTTPSAGKILITVFYMQFTVASITPS